jgi:hypothetical protein
MAKRGPGRPKNPPKIKEMLKEFVPIKDIFSEEEETLYNNLVDIYVNDFEDEELTSGDMDDIMTLATNKILELRLLKNSKDNYNNQLEATTAIDKLRKQTEKIKGSLSVRRRDRIDPNKYKGFSIVDLAVAFDDTRKKELMEKFNKLDGKAEEEMSEMLSEYDGNKYDAETTKDEEEDN